MNEREWADARDLALAFGEAYSEPVAVVLGFALMEKLADVLDTPLDVEALRNDSPTANPCPCGCSLVVVPG